MEGELIALFTEVERHAKPLLSTESIQRLSKEECSVLALQSIHRLNQRIGFLARTGSKDLEEMKLLQRYVNNLTLGVKNDNAQMIRSSLTSVRNLIATISKSEAH